jgi:hypothetical protein
MYGKVIHHLPTVSHIKASLHHVEELKLDDIVTPRVFDLHNCVNHMFKRP